MPRRKDNMLEAFKASGDEASETPSPAAPRALEPPSAGPFAPEAPAKPERERLHPAVEELAEAVEAGEQTFEIPIGPKAFFLAQALALVIAFILGRFSVSPVRAGDQAATNGGAPAQRYDFGGERDSSEPARTADQATAGAADASGQPATVTGLTAADQAFLDPANRVTIQAITYPNTRLGEEKAFETYDFLKQQGFPVVTPRSRGSYLFVFVAAAPSQKDLAELRKSLQAAETPDGRLSFKDAYIVNTSDYR